jgi:hypothetical protein
MIFKLIKVTPKISKTTLVMRLSLRDDKMYNWGLNFFFLLEEDTIIYELPKQNRCKYRLKCNFS